MTQTDLLTWHPTAAEERKFTAFDAANPHLWEMFVRFTFEKIGQGLQHFGARDVLHRIRWETDVAEDGEAGTKINNVWSPWYARKFHQVYPQHAGFFRTREAKADLNLKAAA